MKRLIPEINYLYLITDAIFILKQNSTNNMRGKYFQSVKQLRNVSSQVKPQDTDTDVISLDFLVRYWFELILLPLTARIEI